MLLSVSWFPFPLVLLLVLLPLVVGGVAGQAHARGCLPRRRGPAPRRLRVFNAVRYDDFAIGRGGRAGIPAYRAFVVDRIVERNNGPATREIAAAIEDDLLRLEPYRSLGLTADDVLALGQTWLFDDLVAMSDRVWGWDDDYAKLGAVGREAVAAHPGTYAKGVGLRSASCCSSVTAARPARAGSECSASRATLPPPASRAPGDGFDRARQQLGADHTGAALQDRRRPLPAHRRAVEPARKA